MYTYLALGDSYTIGEMVEPFDSFPFQTVRILKEIDTEVSEPVVIAKTGWTTDELASAINISQINGEFTFVTLLIGVNNQYRGYDFEVYKTQFTQLLERAIVFANNCPSHVVVLSIPDWGTTPFAEKWDIEKIAREIDSYNAANKAIALKYNCQYIDITTGMRKRVSDLDFLVADKLHPSGKEYYFWAEATANKIMDILKGEHES